MRAIASGEVIEYQEKVEISVAIAERDFTPINRAGDRLLDTESTDPRRDHQPLPR